MQKLLTTCPACGGALQITVLTCPECGMELRGCFEPEQRPTPALTEAQAAFLRTFLKCRGNMKLLQGELGLSYPAARKQLDEALRALGLGAEAPEKEERETADMRLWHISEESKKASDIVKRKLRERGGRAVVTSYSGNTYEVWAEPDGEHFGCDALHGNTLTYEVFDVVVDFLRRSGGRAKKGTGRAPLGSEKCGLDTVAGVILHEYFGVAPGGTGLDPSFVVAAILDWAGVARNVRGCLELRA